MLQRTAAASNPSTFYSLPQGIHLVHSAPKAFIRRPKRRSALRLLAPCERVGQTPASPSRALQAVKFFFRHLPLL